MGYRQYILNGLALHNAHANISENHREKENEVRRYV